MAKAATKTQIAEPVKGGKYTRLQAITLPTLKMDEGKPYYVKITSPIKVGNVSGKASKGEDGKDMKPADVCNVVNIETAEVAQLVVGAVLKSELEKAFPDQGYVGKSFEIVKTAIPGKRYKGYQMFEIKPD